MSDVRILIVDDNRDFSYLLELALAAVDGCRVVGVAADGGSALDAVNRLHPDVMLLDMALPETDGLEILKVVGKMSRSPLVFVMSVIRSREICEEAVALGAAHYFVKPIDISAFARIIREAFADRLGAAEKTSKLLNILKVPPDIRGFKYLKEVIIYSINDGAPRFNMIVRRVAMESGADSDAVRRAIRYAISVAWDRDTGSQESFFFPWKRVGDVAPDAEDFVREAVRKMFPS